MTTFSIRNSLTLILTLFFFTVNPTFSEEVKAKEFDLKNSILFLRHAFTPGTGDPDGFVLGKCETQSNLNDFGRNQAVSIGNSFKLAGIVPTAIYNSEWCRSIETAKLLGLGKSTTHKGLNSYFQNFVDKDSTLEQLKKLMATLQAGGGPYLLVTHQIVIKDVTNISPAHGQIVIYDTLTKKSKSFVFDSYIKKR